MAYALLVVDIQNGFINDDTKHIPQKVKELIVAQKYEFKIFSRFINTDNSQFERLLNWSKVKTSPETDIVSVLQEEPTLVVDKAYYGCITQTLVEYVKENNIDEFHIVGIDTDICVLKSAVDLFENGFTPFILTEFCMSTGGRIAHNNAIRILPRFIGGKQVVSDYKMFYKNRLKGKPCATR